MAYLQEIANHTALYFGDGRVFFIGCFLSVAGAGLYRYLTGWISSKSNLIAWIGAIFVFISTTPLSWWLYALWFCLFLSAILLSNSQLHKTASETIEKTHREPMKWRSEIARKTSFPLFAFFTMGLSISEWSHRQKPVMFVAQDQVIYVLGDSISAGIGTQERNWPIVWSKLSKRQIVNLAMPGATISDALLYQNANITSSNAVVIVEIGGNDLLGSTKAADFHDQLDQLLSRLHNNEHRVMMFEIPLLPFCNQFGRSQRTLAEKYDVTLIPKRVLVQVFEMEGATLDGLHLSQIGHDEMARQIHEMVKTQP